MLLKKVKVKYEYNLCPIRSYAYKPLKATITQLARRKGFLHCCELWRGRSVPPDFVCDIYDGLVWKAFNLSEKQSFLSLPHCYLLTLNVDRFVPFERGVYSVGAIYLTIQNLPRNMRYRPENIIIVGIIPGPKEPKKTINSYLSPLVMELNEAWKDGFDVLSPENISVRIKLALTCVTCDIPATRKVCGFLSHNASLGCNKCLKKFNVQFAMATDYSGYDIENWEFRTRQQHEIDVEKVKKEVTKTGIQSVESNHGVRYSVLLELPYFDPVRFTAIDIMHNLFLGTGKHCFEVWVEKGLLSKQHLKQLETNVKIFSVPAGLGRLPHSFSSCYGSFTASQWKNWITIFSPVLLRVILPTEDLRCWLLIVRCCCILSSYCLTQSDITSADLFLKQFCSLFETLYGRTSCTFNMHLHMHLKQVFCDFGPPHSTWCFAFECYNGILGSFHRKFVHKQAIHSLDMTQCTDLSSILPPRIQRSMHTTDNIRSDSLHLFHLARRSLDALSSFKFVKTVGIELLSPFYNDVFTSDVAEQVENNSILNEILILFYVFIESLVV